MRLATGDRAASYGDTSSWEESAEADPAIAPDPSVYDSIKESMRAASSAPEAEETDEAETHENSPIDLSEIFTDDAVIAAAA